MEREANARMVEAAERAAREEGVRTLAKKDRTTAWVIGILTTAVALIAIVFHLT